MGFNTSFIGRHNCAQALSVLNIKADTPDYPKVCICPVCGKYELYIFADFELNSLWLTCGACKNHGDVLSFAANLWNISLPDTAEKFIDFELITGTEAAKQLPEYIRNHMRRQAAETFWQSAKAQLWRHEDDLILCRLREMGLRAENAACSGLIGVAHHDQVADVCSTLGKAPPNKGRKNGTFIVCPFYELPEKLTGFLLLQYNKQLELRTHFVPLNQIKVKKPEAGYCLFDAVQLNVDPVFKNTVVVTDNLFWAIKAQASHSETATQLLPLVVAYSGPDAESYGTSWRHYPGKVKIFHSHAPTPQLISRACNASGYTSLVSVERRDGSRGLVAIRKTAEPWVKTLRSTLSELPETNAAAFIGQLTVPRDKTFEFIAKFDHGFSENFTAKVLANAATKQCILSTRKQIVEKTDGWWSATGQKIINVRPRITTIVYDERGDKMYCGCVETEHGSVYTFQATGELIDKAGLFAYVANILSHHGETVVCERSWNHRGLHFALTLHPPKIITIKTRHGWDDSSRVFRFADYEITETGQTQKTIHWAHKEEVANFEEPIPASAILLGNLNTPAHENSYVWLLVAALLENLLAPVFNQRPSGTVLTEKNFSAGQRLLRLCTCPDMQATAATKKAATGFLQQFKQDLAWPALVHNAFGDEQLSNIVPHYFNQPLFAKLTPTCAAVAPSYGWKTITAPAADQDIAAIKHVIPAFIQHTLKTGFDPRQHNLFNAILQELNKWLANFSGSAFNIEHALAHVRPTTIAHIALIEEVQRGINNRRLAILPQPRKRNQNGNYLLQKHSTVWLNKTAITRYFELAKAPGPNWHHVLKLLKQNDLYVGEEIVYEMGGFLVPADWFFGFAAPINMRETG